MTQLLLLAVAFVAGALWPHKAMLLAPVVLGPFVIAVLAMSGRDWWDTPIPFLMIVLTLAVATGRLARTWAMPSTGLRR